MRLSAKVRQLFLVTILSGVIVLIYLLYILWPVPWERIQIFVEDTRTDTEERPKPTDDMKYILFWTTQLSSETWYFKKIGSEIFRSCKFKNCYATQDRNFREIDSYDAILFYGPTFNATTDIPDKRSPHQRYVFASFETPTHFFINRTQYALDDFYNWTMTYRFDSDISRRAKYVVKGVQTHEELTEEFVESKTRSVAWFVSNCHSTSKREQLGRELQKYIDVDIYGKCGNLTCPNHNNSCYDMVEKTYKFYLAFENSYCKDYTTEKLYNILLKKLIPVAYGGGDYDSATPPHSVIKVEDFDTVEDLAKYLKELSEDTDAYLEYFKWHENYMVTDWHYTENSLCKLCRKLNDKFEPNKVYKNLKHWWFSEESSQCKVGDDLPNIVRNL